MRDCVLNTMESPWRLLFRLRWPLSGTIAVAFALGQIVEALVVRHERLWERVLFDVVAWGSLGGLAVWLSLTWVGRQERRYQAGLEQSLREQQELNRRLQRANSQLALLSDVNRRIADSATLDDILSAALAFPQRLAPARAAALALDDGGATIDTRVEGVSVAELARLRAQLDVAAQAIASGHARLITSGEATRGPIAACLLIPLHDGQTRVGRIELYLERTELIPADELALLDTIGHEIAEAIVSARRRSREERAIYELERAIMEERARIARDIHDGIAQSLAFRRMRIDLWLDWLDSDRGRLRAELIENKQLLREQINELRRAIFALRPVQFDELGFAGGLHRYIVEFAGQHGWNVQVDLGGVPAALSPELEAVCFRIVQEALTNVAKHAQATDVAVLIDQADGGLRVIVKDNGQGFDPGQLSGQDGVHLGLRQMRERLLALRGQLTSLSRRGAGAELRAWIPLDNQALTRSS
jgi:signal transduction histidine kinase